MIRIRATSTGRCSGSPMFDLKDAAGVMHGAQSLPQDLSDHYIRLIAFDSAARRRKHAHELHRQPAEERAGFDLVAPGGGRPHMQLHRAQLRHRQARGPNATVRG